MNRSFTSSVSLLAISYGVLFAATFLMSFVVGRALGATALGDFALAVAIARLFFAATDLGMTTHLTRTVARDRTLAGSHGSLFVTFRAALVPVAVAGSVILGLTFGHDRTATFALVAVAIGLGQIQVLYEALLLAHEQQPIAARLTIVSSLLLAVVCGAWFALRGTLTQLALAYVLASVAAIVVWSVRVKGELGVRIVPRTDCSHLARELAVSWPIGVSVLLGIAALRAPVLVLGWFGTSAEVGAFTAVDMFVTAAALVQVAVTNATFPRLSASFGTDPARFRAVLWGSNAALALVGLAIAAMLVLVGADVVAYLFPARDFTRFADLMPIIAWSTPCLLLVHHNILVFAAADQESANLRMMALWLVAIAGFQLALVPSYGVNGAAWGVLCGRFVGLVGIVAAALMSGIHVGRRPRSTTDTFGAPGPAP